jgi:hypothetical protein
VTGPDTPTDSEPGPHDAEILTLVSNQQPLAAIHQASNGKWDSTVTADVLSRYGLTVRSGGTVVRADLHDDPATTRVISAGLRSSNDRIRRCAARAEVALIELSRELGAHHARTHLNTLRRRAGGQA